MFDQLKAIMQNGERYIVVENGRPEYVFMHFADYVAMTATSGRTGASVIPESSTKGSGFAQVNAELEEVERDDNDFRVELAGMPATMMPDPATIRLEDLPL